MRHMTMYNHGRQLGSFVLWDTETQARLFDCARKAPGSLVVVKDDGTVQVKDPGRLVATFRVPFTLNSRYPDLAAAQAHWEELCKCL